ALAGPVLHLLATRIGGNEILGCRSGAITALGLCGPGASMKVCDNSLNVNGPGITAGVDGLWIESNKLLASTQRDSAVLNGSGIALRTGLDPNGANECQILANQVSGFEDAGILIASPTAELIVKLNIVQRCGNGIVSQDEARSANVAIENNQVSDIGSARAGAAAEVLGIGVLRAATASVVGNSVRRVGQQAAQALLRAGVAASGVERLRISGNDVTDIAPAGAFEAGQGVGVLLRAPFAQADVSHNQVDRESQPLFQGGGRFIALWVDAPLGTGAVSRVGLYAALQVDAATTLVFGATRPFVVHGAALDASGAAPVPRGASASVLGNSLAARGDMPAVRVAASGDCLFSDNRCELRGTGTKIAVELRGGATIVNANRVRGGEVSLLIHGTAKTATVLGNITTGSIDLGGALGAPWNALNLRA
ncbi:MAG TPA: right-handed parallel beta-helix repeat-containing protein, partial [Albitalea sp.]|nr:right-handed parallel beta-helix repeat-containing protein [Albitalea sp.]